MAKRSGFDEIVSGLSANRGPLRSDALPVVRKLFRVCDTTVTPRVPEQAIVKLGNGRFYRVELDLCTGCSVCFEQCPCHAIEMAPEPARDDAAGASAADARASACARSSFPSTLD